MSLGLGTALLGGSLLGGLGGMFGNEQTQRVSLPELSGTGRLAQGMVGTQLRGLEDLIGQGAGSQDVSRALESGRGLAGLLEQYAQGGYLPTEDQRSIAASQAEAAFGAERLGLQNLFEDQRQQQTRLAGQLGRQVNDPVLQAKLMEQQGRLTSDLGARQAAYANQFAMNMPLQQLQFAQQAAGTRQGLAQQAFGNRMQLAGLGQSILSGERGFQQAGASTTMQSGGGMSGLFGGALAGAGAGLNLFGTLSSLNRFSQPASNPIPTQGGSGGYNLGGGMSFNNMFSTPRIP
jgi:hypothetical protein